MSAPIDLPSMVAEIKAKIYANGIGAITAATVQQVLIDLIDVTAAIAAAAAEAEVIAMTPTIQAIAAEATIPNLLALPVVEPAGPGLLWWDGGLLAMS